MDVENIFTNFGFDNNELFLTRIINENIDKNKICSNCRWAYESNCIVRNTYITNRVDYDMRTCEGWELYVPPALILKNHII